MSGGQGVKVSECQGIKEGNKMSDSKIYSLIAITLSILCLYAIGIVFSQNSYERQKIAYLEQELKEGREKESRIGRLAPDFEASDLKGKNVKFSNYSKGKETILFVFLPTCSPCEEVIPDIIDFHKKQNGKFNLISVTLSGSKEHLKKFKKDNKVSFPILISRNSSFEKNYAPFKTPTIFLIKEDKTMRAIYEGSYEIREFLKEKLIQVASANPVRKSVSNGSRAGRGGAL